MLKSNSTVRAARRNLCKLQKELRGWELQANTQKRLRLIRAAQRVVYWMMANYGTRLKNVSRDQMERQICHGVSLSIQCDLDVNEYRLRSVERLLIAYLYS